MTTPIEEPTKSHFIRMKGTVFTQDIAKVLGGSVSGTRISDSLLSLKMLLVFFSVKKLLRVQEVCARNRANIYCSYYLIVGEDGFILLGIWTECVKWRRWFEFRWQPETDRATEKGKYELKWNGHSFLSFKPFLFLRRDQFTYMPHHCPDAMFFGCFHFWTIL